MLIVERKKGQRLMMRLPVGAALAAIGGTTIEITLVECPSADTDVPRATPGRAKLGINAHPDITIWRDPK